MTMKPLLYIPLSLNRERRANPPAFAAIMSPAIGIDLGTANTCTAVYRNGDTEIVLHDGYRSMPSFVAFTDLERLIGAAARNQANVNPRNTVFGMMRLVGRKFSDGEVQAEIKRFPFNVIDKGGKPVISVEYRGETRVHSPEEILSMILGRAKDDAEAHLGSNVQNAVIIVPAYFNTIQRGCIMEAAQICGLNTLRLINGPTAAAIDHTLTSWPQGERKILVVDVGAGTLDVVLVTAEVGILEVRSTASDLWLGGGDFDNRILNHFVQEFKRKHKQDVTANLRALHRLRTACETAKQELSTRTETAIEVDSLYEGIDFQSTLTRVRFEELCQDLFRSIIIPIERVLRDDETNKIFVSDIVAIGGSARIPKIQYLLSQFFNGKPVLKSLNFDEAPARGAAMQAAILSGDPGAGVGKISEFMLMDVAPLSIGIQTPGGKMDILVRRNTLIPTKYSRVFSTFSDNQEHFDVSVFEGERARTMDNVFLGRFTLGPIPPAPRGVPQIEVTIEMDANSILSATAVEKATRIKRGTYIWPKERLSKEELAHMMTEAAKYKADEKAEAERVATKNALEAYIYSCKEKIYDSESRKELDNMIDWLENSPQSAEEEYLEQKVKLQMALAAIATRHTQQTRNESESQSTVRSDPAQVKVESAQQWRKTMQRDINLDSGYPPHPRVEDTPEATPGPRESEGQAFTRGKDPPRQSDPPVTISHQAQKSDSAGNAGKINFSTEELAKTFEKLDLPASPAPDSNKQSHLSQKASLLAAKNNETTRMVNSKTDSDTSEFSEGGLAVFFSSHTPNGELRASYTDTELLQISIYLRNNRRESWAGVPRLYTVLRLIGQLNSLDSLIEIGVTDIWFPFDSASLPDILASSARANFLKYQNMVLSKSLMFEKNPERIHAHFARDEPLPFQVVGRLGFGSGGHVDKVISNVSHRQYARKQLRKPRGVGKKDINSFLMELQILKRINHHHCVELVQSYTDPRYFAVIMSPVADCNLFEYYTQASTSSDKLSLLRSFFGCLAHGLRYLHDAKIRHRDIKPQNILVQADRVLLTDFGIALDWENLSRATTTADSGKTWPYAAPEVASYKKRNSASDVWSLGCVFLEMVSVLKGETVEEMRAFFTEKNESYRIYENLNAVPGWLDKLKLRGEGKDSVPMGWVKQMLREEQESRPTAAKVANDIVLACVEQHVLFCGPCCREDVHSSGMDDGFDEEDEDELWKLEEET